MKFYVNNQPAVLNLTVPNEISATCVGNIISYLWSVEAYSVINQSQNEENTNFEIVLQDQHKSMTLHEYISKIRSYAGISVEVFKFFCQYGVNVDALKQDITSVSEPVLFNEMLKYIEEGPDTLSNNCYSFLRNPLPESIKKLLKCGVDANDLFWGLQIINKNTNGELQLQNLGIVTQDPNFKWANVSLFQEELSLIEGLIDKYDMPISKALERAGSYKVDGKEADNIEVRGRYEEFIRSLCIKAQEKREEPGLVYINTEGFSLETLQNLFNTKVPGYVVVREIVSQVDKLKGKDCDHKIDFLIKNKQYVNWEHVSPCRDVDILERLIAECNLPAQKAFDVIYSRARFSKELLDDKQIQFIAKHIQEIDWDKLHFWELELDILEQLVIDCGMPISKALVVMRECRVDGKITSHPDSKNRYEKFIISICREAQERKENIQGVYVNEKDYSVEVLQALKDSGMPYSVFPEIFRQIKKGGNEISESHIGFLQKNHEEVVNAFKSSLMSHDPLSLEILLQLHNKQAISSEILVCCICEYIKPYYDYTSKEICYKSLDNITLEKAITIGGIDTFRSQFEKLLLDLSLGWTEGGHFRYLPSLEIMKQFYEKKLITPNLLFLYGVSVDNLEIMEQACKDGADLRHILPDDESLFSNMIENASYRSTNVILSEHNIKALPEDILSLFGRFKFAERAHIFSKIYYEGIIDEALDIAGAYGVLPTKANLINILLNFQLQYSSILKDLSKNELLILSDREKVLLSDLNSSDELKNPAGFNLLQLAVIANRFDLALEIIKDNPASINDLSPNGINFFILWDLLGSRWSNPEAEKKIDEINQEILKHSENVDFDIGDGETIADLLIETAVSGEKVLDASKDPLFDFFKSDDISKTIYSFSQDDKIHIAITHYFKNSYESLWDTGMLSSIRILGQKHQNIQFHLITQQNIEVEGCNLLKIFDGIILSGGEHENPNMPEYSNAFSGSYYKILTKADEWGVPLFAMSSGMLNFIIHNGGEVHKVNGYDYKIHNITFIPGTLPYFMSLDPSLQNDILTKKQGIQLPRVSYKYKTQNNFAGSKGKLGANIELSATSEDGEAMACSSGIQIATQYYPRYASDSQNNNDYISNMLDSYIGLVIRNHQHKRGVEEVGPLEYAKIAIDAMQNYLPYEHLANEEEIYIAGDNVEN